MAPFFYGTVFFLFPPATVHFARLSSTQKTQETLPCAKKIKFYEVVSRDILKGGSFGSGVFSKKVIARSVAPKQFPFEAWGLLRPKAFLRNARNASQ